jgi:ABC-2 type transport system permease protein
MELRGSVMNMFNSNKSKKDDDKPQKVSFFKMRSFKYGSMATLFTVLFVVVIVLVNIGVSWASNKYPISVDLTTKQTYKLDAKSIKYIKGINQKITINVLATKDKFTTYTDITPVVKILDQYSQYNSNIAINYVDLTKNPTFQKDYPSETLSDFDFVISCGSRYKHLSINDLVETQTDSSTGSTSVTGFTAEQQLDTALLYVTTNDLPVVTFTTGHSEADSTALQALLKKSNYTCETKNLSSDGVNAKAKAIAIVDPTTDFTSAEIAKIDAFLNNNGAEGKNLIVFFDPTKTALPTLEKYVKEWGIEPGTGIIYDSSNSLNSSVWQVLNGTSDSATVGTLKSNATANLAICRPLNLLFSAKGDYTTTSVLSTMNTSKLWNTPTVNETTAASFTPSSSDKAGPFTVLAKSVKQLSYNNSAVTSNVLVSGSTEAFDDSTLLTQANMINADIITNAMNKLVGGPTLNMNISSKTTDAATIDLTASQTKFLEVLFMLIIPILVLALGFIIWLRRRHL